MSLKTERVVYRSRNGTTGLTDVLAIVRRDGVEVAGPSGTVDVALALAEVSSSDEPGLYELVLSPSQITSYGGAGFYDFLIDSATAPAPAIAGKWLLVNNEDDVSSSISTLSSSVSTIGTNVSAIKSDVESGSTGLAAIKGDTAAIKLDLEDGTSGLAAIKSLIDSVQSAVLSIENNVSFAAAVPYESLVPPTGSSNYRIPITVFDGAGTPTDPDTNDIEVSITDSVGTDFTSYIAGYVSGPVAATRDGAGQYHVDYSVPNGSTAVGELIFSFAYAVSAVAKVMMRTSVIASASAGGGDVASQTTLLDVQTTVDTILSDVEDATNGLAAIKTAVAGVQSSLNDGTFGLSAIETIVAAIQADVENVTTGLSAIKTAVNSRASQSSLDSAVSAIEGASFSSGSDSLHQLSLRIYNGGVAV